MFKFNGKKVSKEKLVKEMENPNNVVSNVKIEVTNDKKNKGPVTNEGFDIGKDLISGMITEKEKFEANVIALSFHNSAKINNNSLTLIAYKKEDLSEDEINAFKVLGISIKD